MEQTGTFPRVPTTPHNATRRIYVIRKAQTVEVYRNAHPLLAALKELPARHPHVTIYIACGVAEAAKLTLAERLPRLNVFHIIEGLSTAEILKAVHASTTKRKR